MSNSTHARSAPRLFRPDRGLVVSRRRTGRALEGVIQIPGSPLRLVVDLAQDAAGQWTGSAIFPDLGIKGTPLAEIAADSSRVAFEIKGVLGGPRITGSFTPDGKLE